MPRAASVLKASFQILATYKAWDDPMTVRQVFYRLIAEYGYPKTEADYKSLVGWIARSRRSRQGRILELMFKKELSNEEAQETAFEDHTLIPFSWIRDEKGQSIEALTYDGYEDFLDDSCHRVKQMRLDGQDGQPQILEIWCEANGMVPLMRDIGSPWTVRVSSGGGYDSVTAKHDLAKRVLGREGRGLPTVVLHVGDFDPSGEGMWETLRDDVGMMVYDFGADPDSLTIERVALTEEQVIEMGVETAPPKKKDARRRGFVERHPYIAAHLGTEDITAQLEALTPPELRSLITMQIEGYIEPEPYENVIQRESEIRDELLDKLEE
jgi:hypothetical protein